MRSIASTIHTAESGTHLGETRVSSGFRFNTPNIIHAPQPLLGPYRLSDNDGGAGALGDQMIPKGAIIRLMPTRDGSQLKVLPGDSLFRYAEGSADSFRDPVPACTLQHLNRTLETASFSSNIRSTNDILGLNINSDRIMKGRQADWAAATVEEFSRKWTYLGVVPLGVGPGVKDQTPILLCAVSGEVIMPNYWGAVAEGTRVGFLVKEVAIDKWTYGDYGKDEAEFQGKVLQIRPWSSTTQTSPLNYPSEQDVTEGTSDARCFYHDTIFQKATCYERLDFYEDGGYPGKITNVPSKEDRDDIPDTRVNVLSAGLFYTVGIIRGKEGTKQSKELRLAATRYQAARVALYQSSRVRVALGL